MQKLNEICSCESKANSETEFVGIRCEKEGESLNTSIHFPLGYFKDDNALRNLSEDDLRECVINLFTVLFDSSLQEQIHQDSSISTMAEFSGESAFPMVSYLNVIRNFLDFGYLNEREILYKKGANGKVSWGRTIRAIQPAITDDGQNLVYLDFIARKVSYNDDTLITQVHKFCVHDALVKLGFLFGIEPTDEPLLDFDYDLFCNAVNSKLSKTFNDWELHLLSDLARIIEYLAGHKTENGKTANEFYFGVNKFAPIWEAMVDRIFGTVSQEEKRDKYNPHLKFVAPGGPANGTSYHEDVDSSAEYKRSTLRPDTIMTLPSGVFILDSKYYKYGLTGSYSHLPDAESVCKQMAYAEYVESNWNNIFETEQKPIYNAFIMPCCKDSVKEKFPKAIFSENDQFSMCRTGYIYGDWKNREKSYHKIACILLDVKSIMRNYANNPAAQRELSGLIK